MPGYSQSPLVQELMARQMGQPSDPMMALKGASRIGPTPLPPVSEAGVPRTSGMLKMLAAGKRGLPEFQELNRYAPLAERPAIPPSSPPPVRMDYGDNLYKRLLERFGGRGGK